MRKLLVICGPTATGKTKLGIYLAKKFKGEIISADSRQVYRKMDIGTGKDLPVNSKLKAKSSKLGGFYQVGGIRIWGYDLVNPKEEFSAGQYVIFANNIIEDIEKRGKLPILAGGTGFYIKGVVDGIATSTVPKNESLRSFLEKKKPPELFEQLAQLDPIRAALLNVSDKKNTRRLVRAVEVASSKLKVQEPKVKKRSVLFIGLETSKNILNKKIEKGIDERLTRGFEEELGGLISYGVSWENQSMSSLGYKQWESYAKGKSTKKEAIAEWKKDEKKYAGRQMTWFKKDKRIKWFDISEKNWQGDVERVVKKWYISSTKN